MPPWPRIRPFSTSIDPGPTCFQPLRSLPSNNWVHFAVSGAAGAMSRETARECQPERTKSPATRPVRSEFFILSYLAVDYRRGSRYTKNLSRYCEILAYGDNNRIVDSRQPENP